MTDDLRTLSIHERIQLVEDIWDSIAVDQAALPLTDEQRVELDRRFWMRTKQTTSKAMKPLKS